MADLIDRQAAIDALKEAFNPSITNFVKAKIAIDKLPSAQPDLSEYSDKLYEKRKQIKSCEGCKWLRLHNGCVNDRCARMYKDRYESERRTDG